MIRPKPTRVPPSPLSSQRCHDLLKLAIEELRHAEQHATAAAIALRNARLLDSSETAEHQSGELQSLGAALRVRVGHFVEGGAQ